MATISNYINNKIHTNVKDVSPRGGASICEVNGNIIIFGGADREQCHFQDLIVYTSSKTLTENSTSGSSSTATAFRSVTASGDVPMPRSGHAVAAFGRFMFLFGGIDFAEESVYNDLYILDTDDFSWHYVGESGEEIRARNSHSLCVLTTAINLGTTGKEDIISILVLYGGASPEHGPLSDTFYAVLPSLSTDIELESFFVTWKPIGQGIPLTAIKCETTSCTVFKFSDRSELNEATDNDTNTGPGAREMHGTCCAKSTTVSCIRDSLIGEENNEKKKVSTFHSDSMFIFGGRDVDGNILSDTWELKIIATQVKETVVTGHNEVYFKLVWKHRPDLQLPLPTCACGAAALVYIPKSEEVPPEQYIFIMGGFSGQEINNSLYSARLEMGSSGGSMGSGDAVSTCKWQKLNLIGSAYDARFGLALCTLSTEILFEICMENNLYKPIISTQLKDTLRGPTDANEANNAKFNGFGGMIFFGGVDASRDFGEIWLTVPLPFD